MSQNEELQAHWLCKNCGVKSPLDAKRCPVCDANLALFGEMVNPGAVPPTPPPPSPSPEPDKKKRKTWPFAVAAVLVLALVSVVVLQRLVYESRLASPFPEKPTATESTNPPATESANPPATQAVVTVPQTTEPTERVVDMSLSFRHRDILLSKIGQTYTFEITSDLTADQITWTSADESIVKVDQDGTVTCIRWGTTTVTAKYGDHQVECIVRCQPL